MKTLEGNKAFPYIAWTIVICFSIFTYTLISGFKESAAFLEAKTQENEKAITEFIVVKKSQAR